MSAKIYISPGHGGQYIGTSGNGFIEKHINLEMALLVQDFLRGYDCVPRLAREGDYTKLISDRTLEANNWNADLVVSLHFNGYSNTSARGFETFVHPSISRYSKTDNIRNTIHDSIYSVLRGKTPNRGKKTADFQILRETKMPAVLIEYSFLTNKEDADLIPGLIVSLAEATAGGIAKALNLKKVTECQKCRELENKLNDERIVRIALEKKLEQIQKIILGE